MRRIAGSAERGGYHRRAAGKVRVRAMGTGRADITRAMIVVVSGVICGEFGGWRLTFISSMR
jgi:hypothetical protein